MVKHSKVFCRLHDLGRRCLFSIGSNKVGIVFHASKGSTSKGVQTETQTSKGVNGKPSGFLEKKRLDTYNRKSKMRDYLPPWAIIINESQHSAASCASCRSPRLIGPNSLPALKIPRGWPKPTTYRVAPVCLGRGACA